MYEQYGWIAESLGEKRPLKARVSYRKSLIHRILASFLLDSDCVLNNDYLERLRRTCISLRESGEKHFITPEFINELYQWLHDGLNREGPVHQLAALATLESQTTRVSQRAAAIVTFLTRFGLADAPRPETIEEHDSRSRASADFHECYNSTSDVIRAAHGSVEIDDIGGLAGIEFPLTDTIAQIVLSKSQTAVDISWIDLSSGLLSLIQQFTRLAYALSRLNRQNTKSVLLLIDEGDAFLHLDWQRQYVEHLNAFLSRLKDRYHLTSLQVLIATHSPIISGDFPSPMVQRLDTEREEPFKTFGNTLDSLVFDAFETSSIGSFAANKIRALHERYLGGTLADSDLALIEEIGDDGLRRAVTSKQGGESNGY
ncbi:AAA family ATPase [Paraburkholderia phenoliruptrix]|uniref:AAA family ATPase n=1 Tax=Paraburkholderia phenoliruptrix TaxID=252970 RepID=UPI0034CD7310